MPLSPQAIAEHLYTHLPEPVAQAITEDPAWDGIAADIAAEYDHDPTRVAGAASQLALRLQRDTANPDWVAHRAHAPARWAHWNLT